MIKNNNHSKLKQAGKNYNNKKQTNKYNTIMVFTLACIELVFGRGISPKSSTERFCKRSTNKQTNNTKKNSKSKKIH